LIGEAESRARALRLLTVASVLFAIGFFCPQAAKSETSPASEVCVAYLLEEDPEAFLSAIRKRIAARSAGPVQPQIHLLQGGPAVIRSCLSGRFGVAVIVAHSWAEGERLLYPRRHRSGAVEYVPLMDRFFVITPVLISTSLILATCEAERVVANYPALRQALAESGIDLWLPPADVERRQGGYIRKLRSLSKVAESIADYLVDLNLPSGLGGEAGRPSAAPPDARGEQ
jgi:hypothetical protein